MKIVSPNHRPRWRVRAVFLAGFVLVAVWLNPTVRADVSASRETLENQSLEAKFSPAEGGRLVSLKFDNSPNLIAFEKGNTGKSAHRPPVFKRPFQDTGGMTLWLAPQGQWWTNQTLFASRRKRRQSWPPDPYGEEADFQVTRPDSSTLRLEGPESPVTGMRLIKSLHLLSKNTALLSLQAVNISAETQKRALWPNIRLPRDAEIWISGTGKNRGPVLTLPQGMAVDSKAITYYETFAIIKAATLPPEGAGKIEISRWNGSVGIFYRNCCWVIRTQPATKCSPGNRPLVIFINALLGKGRCVELEPFGNYTTIHPGNTISMSMQWDFSHLKSSASSEEKRTHLLRATKAESLSFLIP